MLGLLYRCINGLARVVAYRTGKQVIGAETSRNMQQYATAMVSTASPPPPSRFSPAACAAGAYLQLLQQHEPASLPGRRAGLRALPRRFP